MQMHEEIALPVIGLNSEADEAALDAIGQYAAVPYLTLDCMVTVQTKRQRFAKNMYGPLRILSSMDEGGTEDIETLLGQMDLLLQPNTEAMRDDIPGSSDYDVSARQQIGRNALNEGDTHGLALADTAIAASPVIPGSR